MTALLVTNTAGYEAVTPTSEGSDVTAGDSALIVSK